MVCFSLEGPGGGEKAPDFFLFFPWLFFVFFLPSPPRRVIRISSTLPSRLEGEISTREESDNSASRGLLNSPIAHDLFPQLSKIKKWRGGWEELLQIYAKTPHTNFSSFFRRCRRRRPFACISKYILPWGRGRHHHHHHHHRHLFHPLGDFSFVPHPAPRTPTTRLVWDFSSPQSLTKGGRRLFKSFIRHQIPPSPPWRERERGILNSGFTRIQDRPDGNPTPGAS